MVCRAQVHARLRTVLFGQWCFMWFEVYRFRLPHFWVGCLLLIAPCAIAWEPVERPDRVLVLQSYHPTMPWTDTVSSGLLSECERSDRDVELHFEYMDTKREKPEEVEDELLALFDEKYLDDQPDVIIVVDNNGLEFLLAHRDTLFPGVPIVFCGINNFEDTMLEGHEGITGVVEDISIAPNIELVKRLFPETRRIVAITDATRTGEANRRKFSAVAELYSNELEFEVIDDVTAAELAERLRGLPDDTVVFLLSFHRDAAGRRYSLDEFGDLVLDNCDRPVFGFWAVYLDHLAIFGGDVVRGEEQGRAAASLALQILDGADADELPIVRDSPNRPMFRFPAMQEFGVSESELPEGSIILEEPRSLYREHKWLIWSMLAALVSMAVTIAVLVAHIGFRRRVERELQLAKFAVDRHSLPMVRVLEDGSFAYANEATCRTLGYTEGELRGMNVPAIDCVYQEEEAFTQLWDEAKRCGGISIESRLRCKDGSEFPVQIEANYCRAGGEEYLFCFAIDLTEHKAAERALRENEKRFRTLVANIPGIVYRCEISSPWRTDYMSDSVLAVTGYGVEAFVAPQGMAIADIMLPEDVERIDAEVATAIAAKCPFELEYRIRHADGSERWMLDRGQAAFDEQGNALWLDGVIFDVTKERQSQEELTHAQAMLRAAIENSPAGIILADAPDGSIRVCNAAALNIRGNNFHSLTDIPIEQHPSRWQTFYPDGSPYAPEDLPLSRAILEGEVSENVQAIVRHADGQERWVLANAAPIRGAKGEIIAGIVVFSDITELTNAQRELAQHRDNLEALVAERTAEVLEKNRELEEMLANLESAQAQLIRSEKLAVLGRLAAGVAHEVNNPLGAIASTSETMRIATERVINELPDIGALLKGDAVALVQKAFDAAMAVSEGSRTSRGLRELRDALAEELQEASIDKPRDAAVLLIELNVHDEIDQYLPLLREQQGRRLLQRVRDLASVIRGARVIDLAASQAAKIVFALSSYARRREEGVKTSVDPRRTLEDVLTLYHNRMKGHVDLHIDLESTPAIEGVNDEVCQIWTNLIHNALQAMEYRGRLAISLKREDGEAVVRIADSGAGIPEDVRGRVFDAFFTTKPQGEGVGLGLDIVREIVERHGGTIDFTTEVGVGTTFTVRLPVS